MVVVRVDLSHHAISGLTFGTKRLSDAVACLTPKKATKTPPDTPIAPTALARSCRGGP